MVETHALFESIPKKVYTKEYILWLLNEPEYDITIRIPKSSLEHAILSTHASLCCKLQVSNDGTITWDA